ncbi:mannitol dehydrogenase family protein [Methylocapsa sp. S129]|uniref:mannitol dehydrogenase family protein n=1 Tax=Methylocapsa sp. S129 TaxID=1641869 RepID=UPI00131DB12A|nr:mannitol dehydrogenase family protein [Methylocapsa sp. S129]
MDQPSAPRLSLTTMDSARSGAVRFGYDRSRLRPRIVHLGLGAFFRAHGALFTEDVLAEGGGDWGIVGASLKRPEQRNRLLPQNCLYTAVETGPAGQQARLVGCLLDVLVGPESPGAILELLSGPDTEIVTLTVTEKGYCHDPASGQLNADHPDIRRDLANPDAPQSAVGLLAGALARRRAAGLQPFTVATCDNLPRNGALLARLVGDFAALRDDALASWIESYVPFPNGMVDRIVPAEAPGDLDQVEKLIGLLDAAPVMHEPFRQWVLEDRFVNDVRPSWQRAGAQFVSDVAPFEHAKLRMLNGSHSALAYLGYLAGHETIVDVVSDETFRKYIKRFWSEDVIPVLPALRGMDLDRYADQLLARYSNPAIRHRTWQIAMDGSQKLPQRLLSSIRDNLRRNRPFPYLALAVAGWMRYVTGVDEKGGVIDVRDPLARLLRERIEAAGDTAADQARALISVEAVFGDDLKDSAEFVTAVTNSYGRLIRDGAQRAVAGLVGDYIGPH